MVQSNSTDMLKRHRPKDRRMHVIALSSLRPTLREYDSITGLGRVMLRNNLLSGKATTVRYVQPRYGTLRYHTTTVCYTVLYGTVLHGNVLFGTAWYGAVGNKVCDVREPYPGIR